LTEKVQIQEKISLTVTGTMGTVRAVPIPILWGRRGFGCGYPPVTRD